MQSNGAEMLRLACVYIIDEGVKLCGSLHDAVLIESGLDTLQRDIAITQWCMEKASEEITNGFTLRSQPDVVTYPDRFADKLGIPFWNTVWTLLGEERFLLPER
jgi:hypothetical protein